MDSRAVKITAATLEQLAQVGTPTATGILQGMGFRNTYAIGLQPLAVRPGQRMVGRARTLRFIKQREDLVQAQYATLTGSPHRTALESVEPGEVLVVDAGGSLEAAVAGDMFTRRIKERGGTGLVIDGVVRDLSAIRPIGLPLFARGQHGAGITRDLMSVGLQEPVEIGGVPVVPGDVLLGDEDGLVVIPPHVAEEVAVKGVEHEEEEVFIRMKLAEGASLHHVYPPNEETRKELEEWRRQRHA